MAASLSLALTPLPGGAGSFICVDPHARVLLCLLVVRQGGVQVVLKVAQLPRLDNVARTTSRAQR